MLLKSFERPSRDVRAQASFLGAAFLAAGFFSASALGAASFFGAAAFLGAASLAGAALASAAGAASAFGAASFFGAAFLASPTARMRRSVSAWRWPLRRRYLCRRRFLQTMTFSPRVWAMLSAETPRPDRKSTRLNSSH